MKLKNKSPRWYQSEAAEVALKRIENKNVHPIIALPTGSGKTIVICLIIIEYLKKYPDRNILVVSHVKEILDQNYKELEQELDEPIGLYSSGLGRKDTGRVTVVGMQSGRNYPETFKNVSLCIIDEAHLVNEQNTGTYREFLSYFNANYIGITATPFRQKGYVHMADESLFTEICYDMNSYENYNKLVDQGYLTKLYSKKTELELIVPKGVGIVAGDYNTKDLSICFNNDLITEKAVNETIKVLESGVYKKVLVFCININHSEKVSNYFNKAGYKSDFVHSKMTNSRDEVFKKFKNGEIQILTNVSMATIGLDVPGIDMLVMLRNTNSLNLYVQMVGRALRVAPNKTHAIVLDYAQNINTFGPINDLNIDSSGINKKAGKGEMPVKQCPAKGCGCHNRLAAKNCIACGYEFKFKSKLTTESSNLSITKRQAPKVLNVKKVTYNIHKKKNKPDSLRIDYRVGLRKFSRWLAIESNSMYAAKMAKSEIPNMLKDGMEIDGKFTVDNLINQQDKFKTPKTITVDTNEKYPQIESIEY